MNSDEIGKSFYLQSNGSVTLFALSLAGGARSNDWSSAKTKTHRTLVLARTAVAVAKALLPHSFL